jgi:predicted DNA-binding transcriptional regulator AlpA
MQGVTDFPRPERTDHTGQTRGTDRQKRPALRRLTVPSLANLLGPAEVAALIGVEVVTVYNYKSLGILPAPDRTFGRTPMWWASTINRWRKRRPGRGKGGGTPSHRARGRSRA